MTSIANQLSAALATIRTPGDFHASGTSAIPLPRLSVDGVGPVALPLLAAQAEQLIAVAERAPYGLGEKILIDTQVRRTWQIGPGQIRIKGKHWTDALDVIVKRAAAGLGVTGKVEAELYKLLVYDEGSFFVSHRDTEKTPGMFGTLIIALPSVHAGGELLVRHKDREARLELRSDDPSEGAFAAFYADCVHEVPPVTSGCHLALVYNLLRKGRGKLPQPPSHEAEQARLAALLRRWSEGRQIPGDSAPEKLVYPLEHAYTPAELSFATLKGAHAARSAVPTQAAQASGCDLHVALLTIEESGAAEYTGYSSGGDSGWGDDYDDELEADEVLDCSRMLSDWRRPDGAATTLAPFPVEDAEVSPASALEDLEPDEEHFQEASGNEGASFERTYRRAALVLWPRARRLAVLNQGGLSATLPYLGDLTRRWSASGDGFESSTWRQAHELSGHMLRHWLQPSHHYYEVDEPGRAAEVLALLTRLNDTARIEAMLTGVFGAGSLDKSDSQALLNAFSLLPPKRAGELIERIVAASATTSLDACADLLAHCALDDRLCGYLPAAATALLDALPGDPKRNRSDEFAWREPGIEAGFIVDLMTALSRIDAKLADRAAGHLLAWPKTFELDAVLLPAVRRVAEQNEPATPATSVAFERLRAACLKHLRARVAQPLAPPADWTRATAPGCECPRCKELNGFLQDPARQSWTFKVGRAFAPARMNRGDADVLTEVPERELIGRQRKQGLRRIEKQAEPDRTVVEHAGRDDLPRLEAEGGRHLGQQRGRWSAGLASRRGKRERAGIAPDPDQPDRALLDHLAPRLRLPTRLKPRMAGSKRRMAGERQFGAGREDADSKVGRRVARRQDEGRLGQVGPARETLHFVVGKTASIEHDRDRIAEVRQAVKTSICLKRRSFMNVSPFSRRRRRRPRRACRRRLSVAPGLAFLDTI